MMKVFILTVLLSFPNVIIAGNNDGNLFLKYCSYSLKAPESLTDEEVGGLMFCYGTLHGIDGMQQAEKINGQPGLYCPPSGYIPTQGARIAVKYLENHPKTLHMSGSGLLIKALIEAFPCK